MRMATGETARAETLTGIRFVGLGQEGKLQLEKRSSAATLTAIELELFPDLVQAQIFANLMSPALWEWKHQVPRRSGSPVRRKVEGI